jgi:hypothetical protein
VTTPSAKLGVPSPRIAVKPRTVGLLLALVMFAWLWALLGVYGGRGSSDTYVYRQYALAIRSGEVPYRAFGSHWAWLLLLRDLALVALVGVLGFPGRSELAAWGSRRPVEA